MGFPIRGASYTGCLGRISFYQRMLLICNVCVYETLGNLLLADFMETLRLEKLLKITRPQK